MKMDLCGTCKVCEVACFFSALSSSYASGFGYRGRCDMRRDYAKGAPDPFVCVHMSVGLWVWLEVEHYLTISCFFFVPTG